MTIKTTRWGSDVCDCIIDYKWDDTLPEAERVHNYAATMRACNPHAALAGSQGHYSSVFEESGRKGTAFKIVQANNPNVTFDNFRYSFDAARNLFVSIVGVSLNPNQRGTIQGQFDTQLGPGKATLQ